MNMSGRAVSAHDCQSQRIHRVYLSHAYTRLIFVFRRVAQLEQKLDGLVTLLTSKQTSSQILALDQASAALIPRSPVSLDSSASTGGRFSARTESVNLEGISTAPTSLDGSIGLPDLRSPVTAAMLSLTSPAPSQLEPNEQEGENLLLEYKTNLAEQFPFVVLPQNSISQNLHHEKPLLWKAIMVASWHDNSHRQMALGSSLTEDLMMRLLFRAEKSLDLLQSLLVLIAWYIFPAIQFIS